MFESLPCFCQTKAMKSNIQDMQIKHPGGIMRMLQWITLQRTTNLYMVQLHFCMIWRFLTSSIFQALFQTMTIVCSLEFTNHDETLDQRYNSRRLYGNYAMNFVIFYMDDLYKVDWIFNQFFFYSHKFTCLNIKKDVSR